MADKVRIGIVVSEFNSEITGQMLKNAQAHARRLEAEVTYICKVSGAFDMPLMIQALLEKEDVDAVAMLGAIVKGETKHDEIIAHGLVNTACSLAMRYEKPVTLGVSGPGMTWKQGLARADEYARRSIEAAVNMTSRFKQAKSVKPSRYPCIIE